MFFSLNLIECLIKYTIVFINPPNIYSLVEPKINMEKIKQEADGFSAINPKVRREGFVYRSMDGSKSFKNVSREYLLKHS